MSKGGGLENSTGPPRSQGLKSSHALLFLGVSKFSPDNCTFPEIVANNLLLESVSTTQLRWPRRALAELPFASCLLEHLLNQDPCPPCSLLELAGGENGGDQPEEKER